jgi:hypothetical protein
MCSKGAELLLCGGPARVVVDMLLINNSRIAGDNLSLASSITAVRPHYRRSIKRGV